jgi:hypothetical protein
VLLLTVICNRLLRVQKAKVPRTRFGTVLQQLAACIEQ